LRSAAFWSYPTSAPRAMYGTGMLRGAQHSQALYSLFTHIPGLKVVAPAVFGPALPGRRMPAKAGDAP
jgi:pyruvate/2-oxoglutarate/acetoin dehydrogenase E1 component